MEKEVKFLAHDKEYEFYCFDDKSFFCTSCFKLHRQHKVELKADIDKCVESLKTDKKTNCLDQLNQRREFENFQGINRKRHSNNR